MGVPENRIDRRDTHRPALKLKVQQKLGTEKEGHSG